MKLSRCVSAVYPANAGQVDFPRSQVFLHHKIRDRKLHTSRDSDWPTFKTRRQQRELMVGKHESCASSERAGVDGRSPWGCLLLRLLPERYSQTSSHCHTLSISALVLPMTAFFGRLPKSSFCVRSLAHAVGSFCWHDMLSMYLLIVSYSAKG